MKSKINANCKGELGPLDQAPDAVSLAFSPRPQSIVVHSTALLADKVNSLLVEDWMNTCRLLFVSYHCLPFPPSSSVSPLSPLQCTFRSIRDTYAVISSSAFRSRSTFILPGYSPVCLPLSVIMALSAFDVLDHFFHFWHGIHSTPAALLASAASVPIPQAGPRPSLGERTAWSLDADVNYVWHPTKLSP
eukprot:GGOE01063766.1.p1 GENE.GGOE01063766.1~~GGOE01063766.1.p1  ORF type:complete len:190 (+),score=6.00 GGOE01063766.1:106-675(+)